MCVGTTCHSLIVFDRAVGWCAPIINQMPLMDLIDQIKQLHCTCYIDCVDGVIVKVSERQSDREYYSAGPPKRPDGQTECFMFYTHHIPVNELPTPID